MDYDRSYAELELGADCSNCPLRVGGKFCPSSGPDHADVAFVGEAPGAQEIRSGIPFTGPSGKLLQIVNDRYDIKRSEVFLSNATLCRPADGSPPPKSAISACRTRLHNELAARGVDTVVALGNGAASSLLGVEGVTKLRVGPGRTSPYTDLATMRIIPTVHPAACLRQSDMFPSLVTDIGKVVSHYEPWVEPEYDVYDDPMEAIGILEAVRDRAEDVVVDIEVDIEKDTGFDHPDRYGLLCVGIANNSERAIVIGERACADEGVRDALFDALRASSIIAQNGKFDLAGLYPVLGALELSFDTMLANYCLDERPGIHGLKQQAVEHLGAPQYDDEIKQYVGPKDGYGNIPRPLLYKYNAFDVIATWRRMVQQIPLLETKEPEWWAESSLIRYEFRSLRFLHDFLVEASNELMYLELNGIKIDREYLQELWGIYVEVLDGIEDELNEGLTAAGYNKINPRSPKQVKEALQHLRVKVDSTNEDTLNKIIDMISKSDDPRWIPVLNFCQTLLKHRREAKLFGTYVKGPAKRLYKGRVYSTYMLHGTVSGRLASRNPNMQNIVREKKIKKLYIPGQPDNVFVQSDYKQAELRVLCWLADEPFFRDILNDPTRDLFDELTPLLWGEQININTVAISDPERWKDIRVRVKAFVYGLGYGRTEYSIAQEYKMPVSQATKIKNNFFSTIPNIVEWQAAVQAHVYAGKDLISPFGRHRRYHLITEENWDDIKKEALAFLPSSTSSDVCLRAMVRVRRELRGSGAFIRNIVHDSILVDCAPDMANDVAALLDREMARSGQELVGDYVTFTTDTKIGKNWSEV